MDNLTPSQRSKIMSLVKSKNTKPELLIRHSLFKMGLRYRLYKKLPGTPDLTFTKYKTVIFINGCFWHNHQNCKLNRLPKNHSNYWLKKKLRNQKHDHEVQKMLLEQGWRVLIIWECVCKKKFITEICSYIKEFLENESLVFSEISSVDGSISLISNSKRDEIRDNAQ